MAKMDTKSPKPIFWSCVKPALWPVNLRAKGTMAQSQSGTQIMMLRVSKRERGAGGIWKFVVRRRSVELPWRTNRVPIWLYTALKTMPVAHTGKRFTIDLSSSTWVTVQGTTGREAFGFDTHAALSTNLNKKTIVLQLPTRLLPFTTHSPSSPVSYKPNPPAGTSTGAFLTHATITRNIRVNGLPPGLWFR
ncbi:Unknown protein [Striga hermonthica]|uniref:Uncharacterized protein n=1 Tax=Striga hermonthica TaxID=68872 RepID=A0A9N7NK34_STRHE|nr:Unknown protein [Striga hermonthica]